MGTLIQKSQKFQEKADGSYLTTPNLPWYGRIEWNMEENFSMEWKICCMEW